MTTVRPAVVGDASRIQEIYAPIVRETWISFEFDVPDVEEVARRISAATEAGRSWLVAEREGVVSAYAYATTFRARAAYAQTAETTIYVDEARRGHGVGKAVYGALLERLAADGMHRAIGVVALPNEGSERFHSRLGFERVGVLTEVGQKFGRWHDVALWERALL